MNLKIMAIYEILFLQCHQYKGEVSALTLLYGEKKGYIHVSSREAKGRLRQLYFQLLLLKVFYCH